MHAKWSCTETLNVKRPIVHSIKKNVGNVQPNCMTRLYSKILHKKKIVPSASCVYRHYIQEIYTWHAVGKLYAVDAFMSNSHDLCWGHG